MGIDEPRHQRASATVDDGHVVGLNDSQGFAGYRLDQVALYQDVHVFMQFLVLTIEDIDVADERQFRLRRLCCLCQTWHTDNDSQ